MRVAMNLNFSTYFLWLAIGLIPLLLFVVFRYVYRGKLAESMLRSLLKLPKANRERVLNYEKKIAVLFKLSLWPAFMISVGMFLVAPEYLLSIFAGLILLVVIILLESRVRRELIDYLEAKEILK
jgi:hypothetical protein